MSFATQIPTVRPLAGASLLATALRAVASAVRKLRIPSQEELDQAYLEQSGDIYELEYRMRQLDRRRSNSFI